MDTLVSDIVLLLREKLEGAISSPASDGFEKGRQFGLYEALSLIKEQAITFGIDLKSVGMGDFDPDTMLKP